MPAGSTPINQHEWRDGPAPQDTEAAPAARHVGPAGPIPARPRQLSINSNPSRWLTRCAHALLPTLVALLAVSIVGCGPESTPVPAASVTDSGVRGIVLLGPTCAAQPIEASPCLTPYAAQLVIVDGEGNTVAKISSGSDGRFQVALPPGEYQILPSSDPSGYPSGVVPFSVVAGDFTDVEVDYDTGIR